MELTKGHELDKLAKQYIIDCIEPDAYTDRELNTDQEKLTFLHSTFISEHSYNIPRVGFQKAFMEWCQGLPTPFNIVFYNYDIIQLAIKWGSLPEQHKENQADKILNNYWNFIAVKTCQLFRKYNLNT